MFRFASSKNASLFLQRKNPRKIAWTVVYRRMHKKGITEEVAKKRSRRTVKHQRGIVGADLAAIAAKRDQTSAVRQQARLAAITKAKTEKKEKEAKKVKVRILTNFRPCLVILTPPFFSTADFPPIRSLRPQGLEAADEGWQGWPLNALDPLRSFLWLHVYSMPVHDMPFFPALLITDPASTQSSTYRISTPTVRPQSSAIESSCHQLSQSR